MRVIGTGREATVYEKNGKALWVGNRPDFHPECITGWMLCQMKLSPPHFPAIYSISRGDYLRVTMELVEGDTLLIWSEVQSSLILYQLKDAGILHRDIRPDNIIVRPNGDWCLVDFGWACSVDDSYPAPSQVGGKYGQDDRAAMQIIKKELQ